MIQLQSINHNTDICCLIKYDYSGYRNPCIMQIYVFRRVWVVLDDSAVADGARVWGWWPAGINLGTKLHVYQPPGCHKLSPNWLSISSSSQGETPQHPPAGRCLRDPERVLPFPGAVSPEISLWGFFFFWTVQENFNEFSAWYLYQQNFSATQKKNLIYC